MKQGKSELATETKVPHGLKKVDHRRFKYHLIAPEEHIQVSKTLKSNVCNCTYIIAKGKVTSLGKVWPSLMHEHYCNWQPLPRFHD